TSRGGCAVLRNVLALGGRGGGGWSGVVLVQRAGGLLKLANAFANGFAHLGQLAWSKDDQRQDQDDHQLRRADPEHANAPPLPGWVCSPGLPKYIALPDKGKAARPGALAHGARRRQPACSSVSLPLVRGCSASRSGDASPRCGARTPGAPRFSARTPASPRWRARTPGAPRFSARIPASPRWRVRTPGAPRFSARTPASPRWYAGRRAARSSGRRRWSGPPPYSSHCRTWSAPPSFWLRCYGMWARPPPL